MKFGIKDLYIMPLSSGKNREHRHREDLTFLTGVNRNTLKACAVRPAHSESRNDLLTYVFCVTDYTTSNIVSYYQGSAKCQLTDKPSSATSVHHSTQYLGTGCGRVNKTLDKSCRT